MNKCQGCGALLQTDSPSKLGFCQNVNNGLCQRCFRIKNYNDYKIVLKDNQEYIQILSQINKKDLVVLVVDLFNIPKDLERIKQYISNKILLVLNKRDLLPTSLYEERLKQFFNQYQLNIIDTVIVSSKNNYNYDALYRKITSLKTSENVYLVGFTNAGKSTMINKLIYNYTNQSSAITVSPIPSTTIDTITIKIDDDLTLIDTPGILDSNNLMNTVDPKDLKLIVPNKQIKPITYQIKTEQTIILDKFAHIICSLNSNITIYASPKLDIKRQYHTIDHGNFIKHEFNITEVCDIVINGLGFIKVSNSQKITIYTLSDVDVYVRQNLI